MPPPGNPAASAPTDRRRWILAAIALGAVAFGVPAAYVALHPVRLLAQARRLGPMSHYVPLDDATLSGSSCPGCPVALPGVRPGDTPNDGTGADGDFPLDAHRQIVLMLPAGHLYLASDDAPQIEKPRIGAFPPGFNTIIGVSGDHLIYGAQLETSAAFATAHPGPKGSERPSVIDCLVQGLLENRAPAVRFRVPAPRVGRVSEMALSHRSDRLVWVIHYTREPYSWVAWGAKYLKFLAPYGESRRAVSVWTTDLHGGHAVPVGEETEAVPVAGSGSQWVTGLPANFSWSPDAKEIRFSFDGVRYAVTAPQS